MNYELVKAHLNLYAVLQNLEDLVKYDPEMSELSKNWRISIQFSVRNGPKACVEFKDGQCTLHRNGIPKPTVKLFFTSPAHLNKMMDGNGNPIPLKGFTKLPFLSGDFTKLTDKLEYYLKPTDALLEDKTYLAINTRMTLNTAAFAIKEIGTLDPTGKLACAHIRNGIVLLKILPDGPAANIHFNNGNIEPGKGEIPKPMACMLMKNMEIANAFLNSKIDPFTAIASGDVMIKGQTAMLDSLSLVLDRIPYYLE